MLYSAKGVVSRGLTWGSLFGTVARMLRIRLQRVGRIKLPAYRIIVVEAARAAKKRAVVEEVGSYDPKSKVRVLKADRINYWISVGAQPTGTLHNMLVSEGILKGKKVNVLPKKTVEKKEEPAAAPTPVAAPAPETPEVVAEAAAEAVVETPAA